MKKIVLVILFVWLFFLLLVLIFVKSAAADNTIILIGGCGKNTAEELQYLQKNIPGAITIAPDTYWPLSEAAADVLWQIEKRGINGKLILIGHSWGGLVARQIDSQNPGLVQKVITIGTPNGGFWFAPRFVYSVDDAKSITPIYVIAGLNDKSVSLSSAMDVGRQIEDSMIFSGVGHADLIKSAIVAEKIRIWLGLN